MTTDRARRTWIVGGVAASALALAGGVALRRRQDAATAQAAAAASAAAARDAAPGPDLRLPARLEILDAAALTPADWQGRPLVLNFWAPWCGPCVKELPDLDRFSRAQAARGPHGAQVIGVALDELTAVRDFLGRHPVSFPISVLGFAGLAWVRKLSNDPSVGLPFTAVFDAAGQLSHKKFGPTDVDELTRWTS